MKSRAILTVYGILTLLLAAWLFGSWYEYGMADFVCRDRAGHRPACIKLIQEPIELRAKVAVAMWLIVGLFVAYSWKKR